MPQQVRMARITGSVAPRRAQPTILAARHSRTVHNRKSLPCTPATPCATSHLCQPPPNPTCTSSHLCHTPQAPRIQPAILAMCPGPSRPAARSVGTVADPSPGTPPLASSAYALICRRRFTISMAPVAHSKPLLPAFVPARSMACSMFSVVSTPNITGTPVLSAVVATPFETSLHT